MTQLTQQTFRNLFFKMMTFNDLIMSTATTKRENFLTMLKILFEIIIKTFSAKTLFVIL